MSLSEDGRRVVIDPVDVNDSDGTVRGALVLCCTSIGEPIGYNPFQSMYFALIREHKCRDEGAVPEETGAARQKRIRALYQEVLSDLWGSEYRTQIPPAPIVAVSIGESTLAMSAESEEPGLATEGEEQQFPPRFTAGILRAPTLEEGGAQEYDIGSPRVGGQARSVLSDSPDRLLLSLKGIDEIWDEQAATHTEVSSEAEERMVELASSLHLLPGMESETVGFVTSVEQLIPDYRIAYANLIADKTR